MKANILFFISLVLAVLSGLAFYIFHNPLFLEEKTEVVIMQNITDRDIDNAQEAKEWVDLMHHLDKEIDFVTISDDSQKKVLDFLEKNHIFFKLIPQCSSIALLELASSYPNSLMISPQLLSQIAKATPSTNLFKQAIHGYPLDKNQYYILSYFDNNGRFRISPSYRLSLNASFAQNLSLLKQKKHAQDYQEYLSLLQQRSHLSPEDLKNNRLKRLQWLQHFSCLSVYEPGFFSQIEGEHFWQSLVWNRQARYLIPPKQWPVIKGLETIYQPLIPFKEIEWISPKHAHTIATFFLLYNDSLFFEKINPDFAYQLRQEAQNTLATIPFEESQTLIELYGKNLFDNLF